MKQVILSKEAKADLSEIGDYIATENPLRAATYIGELYEKAQNIGTAPLAYQKRPDLGPDSRVAIYKPYLIVFRVTKNFVEILRTVHGARNLSRLFGD